MKKKAVSILLSLCMVLGLLPVTAQATTYSNSSITELVMAGDTIQSATVQFTTTGTYAGGNAMLVVHPADSDVSSNPQSKRSGSSENDLTSFPEPYSAPKRMSDGTNTFSFSSEDGFSKESKLALWIYYNGEWVCDQVWDSSAVQNMVDSYQNVYHMYAGDYVASDTEEEKNGVYYNATDGKLHWSCPATDTLVYHKTDGTIQNYSGFTRYYCEAYISPATNSTDINPNERFTATGGGDLNVGDLQQNKYCSATTTTPWIQVGQWLKTNNTALPSGNLWIRVSACNSSNQIGDVIFWINAGEISKLVPGNDLYVSANGNDSTGDGTENAPYATLSKAYTVAAANGDCIVITSDLTIDSTVTFNANKNVTIKGGETGGTIKNGQDNAHMLTVSQGSVTFENITLDGQKGTVTLPTPGTDNGNSHALLNITGGTVTLGNGAVLQNNNGGKNYSGSTAGAVLLTGGTLNMKEGAAIQSCEADQYGGAILVGTGSAGPTFNMEGGSITGNKTTTNQNQLDYGGTVYIWNGTMNMTGGSITDNAVTQGGGAGVLLYSGAFNLSGDSVITGNTTEMAAISSGQSNVSLYNGKTITIPSGKSMGANAQVGVYTVTEPTQGNDVQFTTGGNEADKKYFTSDNATAAGVVYQNNALWLSVDARSAATGGVDAATGEGFITFDGNSSFKYAVRIPGATPTIPAGVKAYNADGSEITKDAQGYFQPAATGKITFKPLPVGVAMELVSVPAGTVAPGDEDMIKTPAAIPAVSLDQLSAQVADRKTTLTIDPAAPNTSYALVDKDGSVVKFNDAGTVDASGSVTWAAADTDGKVVFKGLNCGEQYTVVASTTGDTMPDDSAIKILAANNKVAVTVTTPADTFKDVDSDAVTNVPTGGGKSNITINPTVSGQQYAVIDPATGETVGEWTAGTGAALTFEVDATKDYRVVTRTGDGIVPGKGAAVPAASGAMKIDIHSNALTDLKLSGGVYSYRLGNAAVKGVGGKTFEIGVDTGYFTVDTDVLPTGCTLYSSLTTNGVLATNGTPKMGTNYTYLQFKCGENVSGSVLQQYLRKHVTFHRPAGVEQKVTALAENVELPNGTEAFMGHYYQFVDDRSSSWTAAYAGAKGKTFNGLTGYLLTVTNSNEHNYIYQKFGKNGWMGATRSVPTGGYDQTTFTLGSALSWDWKWVCGPEADTAIGTQYANSKGMRAASYANWHSGEPNGKYVPGTAAANEGFGQYGYGSYGRWNDLPDRVISGIQGYYVEFGGYDGETLTTLRAMDTRTVTDPAADDVLSVSGTVANDGKASLTIAPTDSGYKYAVVDENGTVVNTTTAAPWTTGNGDSLTFEGLNPGKTYHIVSVPVGSDTTAGNGVVDSSGKLDGWPDLTGKLAEMEATAVTPVAPGTLNPVRDGSTVTVPEATDSARDYALVDSKGNLVTDWTNGKAGGLTFEGLNPDEAYTLVESGHVDTATTPDPIRIYDPDKGVKVLPVPGVEELNGAYDAGIGKSSLTIDPAQSGLTYTATPAGGGEPITGVSTTDENGVTTVTFPGLEPNGEYQIAVSDGTNTTKGPEIKAPVAAAASPERTESGEGASKKDTVTLPGEATKADQVYALVDGNGNYIKADGTLSVDSGGKPVPVWVSGTGAADSDLVWTNLDPDATYRVLTAAKDGSNNAPTANSVPAQTVVAPKMQIEAAIDPATGKGVITVKDLTPGETCTVDGATYTADANGTITVPDLTPGKTVAVNRADKGSADVTIPAVGANQISGKIAVNGTATTDDDASVTIDPSADGVHYAVVGADGKLVTASKPGNGGALTFDGLKPDTAYRIVTLTEAKNAGDNASEDAMKSAVAIDTSVPSVDPDQVVRAGGTDNTKDKITISDSKSDLEYAIIDRTTGNIVVPAPGLGGADTDNNGWVNGTGSALAFDGLDPTKTYKVLVKNPAVSNAIPAAVESRPNGTAVPVGNVTAAVDGQGTADITVNPSASGKKYVVVDKDNKVVATGTGNGSALTFSGDNFPGILPGQTYTVAVVDDNVEVGGTVTPNRGAGVNVPVAGENGITIREDLENAGRYVVTVKPTNPGVDYVLVDANGAEVATKPGKENNGSVVFDNLESGKTYHVVTVPKNTEYTTTQPTQPGIAIPAAIQVPTAAEVSKTADTVTVNPTVSGQSYNLLDSDGKLVKEWTSGNGNSITFNGLTSGKTYTVVVRLDDIDSGTPGSQPSGTVTGPAVTPMDGGSSNDVTVTPDSPVKLTDGSTVTQDESNKVTVTPSAGSDNGTITIELPENTADKITVDGSDKNAVKVPTGGKVTIKDSGDKETESFKVIEGTGVVKPNGTVTSPIGEITKVQYKDGRTTEISEVEGDIVSQVEVKPNTLLTTADHKALQDVAEDGKAPNESVTVKLTVEEKNENDAVGRDKINEIKGQVVNLNYLDMTLIKTTTTGTGVPTPKNITDTGTVVLEIQVSFDFSKKKDVTVFRYHQASETGTAEKLTQITSESDKKEGSFLLGADKKHITIYASKFSTYAIGYSEATSTEPGNNPGGGSSGGSGGAASPTVKVDNSAGGTVTLSSNTPNPGDKVTVTVKPDAGKAVAKITVTDSKGSVLEVVDNKDGTYTYIQPEKARAPVTIKVEYKSGTDAPNSGDVSKLLITDRHIVYMNGDGNGRFRPLSNMTRAEAAQVFYNLLRDKNVPAGPAFTDVPADAWYAPAVQALSGLGIINGVGDQRFAPERSITRAEFVAIASRFAGQSGSGGSAFPDVPENHWAYGLIGRAVYYGWVRGYDDGTFRPDHQITRAETVRIVNVMLGRSGDKRYIDANAATLRLFPDVAPDYWAYYEIAEAANAHEFAVSNGMESWNP